jgi:hypothetical protein
MKGVAFVAIVLAAAFVGFCGTGLATPPLIPPVQYEQFCENQKVSGTGIVDVSTSIIDKKIALEYYNVMAGDGDLELDSEHAYSQNADKLKRNISSVNNGNMSNLNLIETTKLTYSGATPLTGGKYLHSKSFYGGIGADIQEMFSVNQMEKDQTSFFSSTTPYNPVKLFRDAAGQLVFDKNGNPIPLQVPDPGGDLVPIAPEDLITMLKDAGRNNAEVEALMHSFELRPDKESWETAYNPAHLIGIETKNSFNGTWGTDAKWHRIFYKDIKAHEMFTGQFEAEKTIKFHENPVPEKLQAACDGIDC